MRTYYKLLGLVAALAIFAVGTAVVMAQSQTNDAASPAIVADELVAETVDDTPQTPQTPHMGQMGQQMAQQMGQMQMTQQHTQMGPMAGNCNCELDAPLMGHDLMREAMAQAMGLSSTELDAALADGTRLPHLMAELGVTPDAVRTAMIAARETAVSQALADGTITQEQADCILDHTPRGPTFNGQHRMEQRQQHQQDGPRQHGRMGQRG